MFFFPIASTYVRYLEAETVTRNSATITCTRVSMTFLQTVAILYGEKHFPAKTPRRWHLMAEFVGKFTSEVPHYVAVSICIGVQMVLRQQFHSRVQQTSAGFHLD